MAKIVKDPNLASLVNGDAKVIDKLLKSLASKVSSVLRDKNVAAASCLVHVIEHANPVYLNRLVNVLGDAERIQALVKWAVDNGPVSWEKVSFSDPTTGKDVTKNAFTFDKTRIVSFKQSLEADRTAFIKALTDIPYWSYVKPTEIKPYNIHAALNAVLKRAESEAKKNVEGSNISHLDDLRSLVAKTKVAAPFKAEAKAA